MVRIGVCSILAASPVLHLYFTYFYLSNEEEIVKKAKHSYTQHHITGYV